MTSSSNWKAFENSVTRCERCVRLRAHCKAIAQSKRKAFISDSYWGKPVPSFGDSNTARLVIVGLAPAAHGANRTGRMFTGDRSGEWLYRALHKAGFASQALSHSRNDRLRLTETYITAVVRCAPPDNKPTPQEIAECASFLHWEFQHLDSARVYLALGKLAFDQTWNQLKTQGQAKGTRPNFGHGKIFELESGRWLLASYHPSQQNTFTGKLTEPMFDAVFERARQKLSD